MHRIRMGAPLLLDTKPICTYDMEGASVSTRESANERRRDG